MKVDQITVSIGITRNLGNFESARLDLTNRFVLDAPLDIDSKEYRMAHRKAVTCVQQMAEKAESIVVPTPEGDG